MSLLPPAVRGLSRRPLSRSVPIASSSSIPFGGRHQQQPRRPFHPSPPSTSSRPLDPYAVLALDRKATKKDIKERFYELSKKYHPDLRPDDADAKAKYLEISAAYDTLGNASKRSAYDNSSHGRPAHFSGGPSSSSPNLSRTGRQSTWVHPSTRMPPRAKGASGPSAAWSGRRQGGATPMPGYSTGRESPFRGTTSSFGPYGSPESTDHAAWDKVAQDEFAKPLRRTRPSLFERAVPTRDELAHEIHTDGLRKAFGLGMLLSVFIGIIAGVQGTMFWETAADERAADRRRNDDDSRLARRRDAGRPGSASILP